MSISNIFQPCDAHFDYKLNYLEKCSRSDKSGVVHEAALFVATRTEHGKAIHWLGRYLIGNKDKRIQYLLSRPFSGISSVYGHSNKECNFV
jgi:hypothetical protein